MMAQIQLFAYRLISKLQQFVGKLDPTPQSFPQPEEIKLILIGFPSSVTSTIHHLLALGYASVRDWSPLQRTAIPGKVMSILIRQIIT